MGWRCRGGHRLCRRHHGDVPLEGGVLGRELGLCHQDKRDERHGTVQEDGDEPSKTVRFFPGL
jgi:hypothetical protein